MQITMHKDNLHYGDVEHRDLHNFNGALVHMATVQGLEERGKAIFGSDGDRPFVLSRSFFAGSQRSGPIWTGDNVASWEHLRLSVPMLLSISVAGLPFAGMHSHAAPVCFFGSFFARVLSYAATYQHLQASLCWCPLTHCSSSALQASLRWCAVTCCCLCCWQTQQMITDMLICCHMTCPMRILSNVTA